MAARRAERQRGTVPGLKPPAATAGDLPAPFPLREARVSSMTLDGHELTVLSFPVPELKPPLGLTPAERAVLEFLWRGASSQEIASKRGTSYRTVAVQLASIYKKAGVGTRAELLARLSTPAPRRRRVSPKGTRRPLGA